MADHRFHYEGEKVDSAVKLYTNMLYKKKAES